MCGASLIHFLKRKGCMCILYYYQKLITFLFNTGYFTNQFCTFFQGILILKQQAAAAPLLACLLARKYNVCILQSSKLLVFSKKRIQYSLKREFMFYIIIMLWIHYFREYLNNYYLIHQLFVLLWVPQKGLYWLNEKSWKKYVEARVSKNTTT